MTDKKSTWDQRRIVDIMTDLQSGKLEYFQAANQIVDLLGSVRLETVDWTWTQARSQYDKGLDPRRQNVAALMEQATQDLNPEMEDD